MGSRRLDLLALPAEPLVEHPSPLQVGDPERAQTDALLAELSGLAHHPAAPISLLYSGSGRPVAGLRVPLPAAARFRLRLTMVYANFIGQRRVVLARLDEAVAANRRSRPPAPAVVTAEHAPARARLAHPAILAAAVALIALPAYAVTSGWVNAQLIRIGRSPVCSW